MHKKDGTKSSIRKGFSVLSLLLFSLLMADCSRSPETVSVFFDQRNDKIKFAAAEVSAALKEVGVELQLTEQQNAGIVLQVMPAGSGNGNDNSTTSNNSVLKSEGFSITKTNGKQIIVSGADDAGVMYGGLELAEQIRLYGLKGVRETLQNPYMELRGTKFNIPLDVRTPSYTDMSDAAQKNIPEMWNFDFWKEYIDNLARYRYNLISLWSLHPFPSMVKVPEYPGVALDDVQRSSARLNENYDLNGTGFDAPEILENAEIVRKISIGEKIEFWRKVMNYAAGRNIRFVMVTWNIFTNGTSGKYGITNDIGNKTTRDYFRQSVKQLFLTYPDLAGVGLTTGENMPGASAAEKEEWAFDTYAQGVLDAASEQPERKFLFIHRQHQTGAREIGKQFATLMENKNVEFLFSFKYAQAHVFSSIRQNFHTKFVNDIGDIKTMWTLRNDDNYYFRWGAPGFVREFIRNMPQKVTRGFYYGSDQWVWGREFLTRDPGLHGQPEIVKHWYHWLLWGRLGYNPDISDERFISILHNRFPGVNAERLFNAWQEASLIYPETTGFHWGALDFQWYIEACKSRPEFARTPSGFHDVNRFITLAPHPASGFQSIPDYVDMVTKGGTSELVSPFQVSDRISKHAGEALELSANLRAGKNKELGFILNDIASMAYLGKYYASKIQGAANLALFRKNGDEKYRAEAVKNLTDALTYWELYTGIAIKQYINPLWTNRVGFVDWIKLTDEVKRDIEIARSDPGVER